MSSNNAPCNKFECKICGKIYKRRLGLTRHAMTIKEANSVKSTIYDLPEKAIEETRQVLVYHIKERLKQHSKHLPSNPSNHPDPLQKSCLYQESDPLQEPDPLQELHLCQEPDSLQEPDPLQDQTLMHAARKQRTRKLKPIQIVIGWKRKSKSDVRNIVYSSGFAFINFTILRTRVVDNLY
ncbi:unnamed protein product [Rhizophagus irregularis]|nr:unnamed protein product [Rhizophagus irregularis]